MKRSLIAYLTFLFAAASLHADIRVSAAASLNESMTEVARLYEADNGEKVILNFAGSNALARQLEAGAPCDVFFSADEATLDQLLTKRLVHENSVTRVLGNSLVVITSSASPLKISSAADLATAPIRHLALGDPAAVPAGVYAKKWLESQNVWNALSAKVVAAENVRAALSAVNSGNAEAGVVYKTDAMTSKQTTVAYQVPADQVPAIVYPAAAAKSSTDPSKAIHFIRFLQSDKALEVFKKYGFIALPVLQEK